MIDRTDCEMKLRRDDASSDVLELLSGPDLVHDFGVATQNPVQGQTKAQHDIRIMSSSRLLGKTQAAEDADVDIAMLKSISGDALLSRLLGIVASAFQVSLRTKDTLPPPQVGCYGDRQHLCLLVADDKRVALGLSPSMNSIL